MVLPREIHVLAYSRRHWLKLALAGAAVASMNARRAVAGTGNATGDIDPSLLQRALAALQAHQDSIPHTDCVGVADFSLPSRTPRFHIVRLADGAVRSYWVAHGRGSDPSHTGWLERFSNEPGSYASSAGAYKTGDVYVGAHGQSIRLEGLDASNSNALSRAIVVHGAWYVSEAMIGRVGVLAEARAASPSTAPACRKSSPRWDLGI